MEMDSEHQESAMEESEEESGGDEEGEEMELDPPTSAQRPRAAPATQGESGPSAGPSQSATQKEKGKMSMSQFAKRMLELKGDKPDTAAKFKSQPARKAARAADKELA